jgi:quinol monooxygenase YgiN
LQSDSDAMVLASISFRLLPHKRAEALSAVDALAERMRSARGCARIRVMNDTEDANAFTMMSEWQEANDADAFFNSREFQIFRGIRILLRDEPYIVFDDVRTRMTRLMRG